MSEVVATRLRERILEVRRNISEALERSGRGPDEVRVLVASKYYSVEQMEALSEAGADLVGENRAEELAEKQERFEDDFDWHFIGHVQRRKARIVVPRVTLIHSIDSVKLIEELAKRAGESPSDAVRGLIQVNVSGEESKYGVEESGVEELLEAAAETDGLVDIRGFMTIAPIVEAAENVRYVFAKLRGVRDELKAGWGRCFDLSELSMGMSGDYVIAVEEGSTLVRIGRTLIEEDGAVKEAG